ncbi:MAG: hypothetical protein IBJ00_04885 [Alphaproteobacteria bacterium]|nr:hypothetical protein [Alphaproteobacteria bacterium]
MQVLVTQSQSREQRSYFYGASLVEQFSAVIASHILGSYVTPTVGSPFILACLITIFAKLFQAQVTQRKINMLLLI